VCILVEASPKDLLGRGFSFAKWNERLDGFSISSALFSHFTNLSIEYSNIPGWQNLDRSRDFDSPTVILDVMTGERVDHFGELDYTTPETDVAY